jgi:hypothetical protein
MQFLEIKSLQDEEIKCALQEIGLRGRHELSYRLSIRQ